MNELENYLVENTPYSIGQIREAFSKQIKSIYPKIEYVTRGGVPYAKVENWTMPPTTMMGEIRWCPFYKDTNGDTFIRSNDMLIYSSIVNAVHKISLRRYISGEST